MTNVIEMIFKKSTRARKEIERAIAGYERINSLIEAKMASGVSEEECDELCDSHNRNGLIISALKFALGEDTIQVLPAA